MIPIPYIRRNLDNSVKRNQQYFYFPELSHNGILVMIGFRPCKNSYRVLLTRGRDGFVIFVPPAPEMDEVYNTLLSAGVSKVEYAG